MMRIISDPAEVIDLIRTLALREKLSVSFGRYECMCCKQRPAQGCYLCVFKSGPGFRLMCAFCGLSNKPYTKWNGFYTQKLLRLSLLVSITLPHD